MNEQPTKQTFAASMRGGEHLAAVDLYGRGEIKVTIESVEFKENFMAAGRTVKKAWLLKLAGLPEDLKGKRLMVPTTGHKASSLIYNAAPTVEGWKGKQVTLYVENVQAVGGGLTKGIRIKK